MRKLRSVLFLGLLVGPTSVGTAMIYEVPLPETMAGSGRMLPSGTHVEATEERERPHDRLREGELEFVRATNSRR